MLICNNSMTLDDNIFNDVFLGPYNNFSSPLQPIPKMVSCIYYINAGIQFVVPQSVLLDMV